MGSKFTRGFIRLRWAPPPGASVFDSKVLCQEMYVAARRSGMLDAGLLLVSYSGEVRSRWNMFFFWEDSLVGDADFCTET